MMFQIFSFKITIQKDTLSETEALHNQNIQTMMDEVKERQSFYSSHL
ncbi:YrzI family small protein [Bacillus manliponensis]